MATECDLSFEGAGSSTSRRDGAPCNGEPLRPLARWTMDAAQRTAAYPRMLLRKNTNFLAARGLRLQRVAAALAAKMFAIGCRPQAAASRPTTGWNIPVRRSAARSLPGRPA